MAKHRASSQESFQEFVQRNGRTLAYVGVGIVVLAGGAWFYVRSKTLKEQHATQAYRDAMQSIYAGNAPLAQSDLGRLSVRYAGTAAGTEGAMALAKLNYTEGKFQAGVDVLKAARPVKEMAYDVHALMAVGYEGLGKNAEAGKEYEAAAAVARFDSDRDGAKASAARAYQAAGKRDDAIRIWEELAKDPEAPPAAEARVRLGELTATPMKV